ncbi:MAG: molybdopterin-dependent oxidoreductase [Acidimicrobiia bacterium]|nr:molybdopterin-dependent oxidoreductase [Acidimicrobiia bacterium]
MPSERTAGLTADLLPSKPAAALSGAVGVGVAIAVGEIASKALNADPSPLYAVGGAFIDRFAGSLKDIAIQLFGKNDKTALIVGTVIISLCIGALIGLGARRRQWLPLLAFSAFGVFGAWAQTARADVGILDACLTALYAVAIGLACTHLLLRLATPRPRTKMAASATAPSAVSPTSSTRSDQEERQDVLLPSRRRFLGTAGGLIVLAYAGVKVAGALAGEDVIAAVKNIRIPRPFRRRALPALQPFKVSGVADYVTPTSEFYRIDTSLRTPNVDASTWRLKIRGLVDNPIEISYAELLAMPSIEEVVTLSCVSNEVGGDLVGNAVWQGVPLSALLERAGVQAEAEQLFSRSVDGWTCGFPIEAAADGRVAMVAYAMNGDRLPTAHGFPARLVVSGLYGYVSATKWLQTIELTTWQGANGFWVPRGWSKEGPVKLSSRIDVPRSGSRVKEGMFALGGVAWSPSIGVSTVEVSIDNGPWQAAELGNVASEDTWVQWRFLWSATSGTHTARVRATDRNGSAQVTANQAPAPNGATGLHQISFSV